MILDATTKSLEIKLGEAVASTNCDVIACWGDYTATTFTPGETGTVTNGVTAVAAAAAPAASTQRLVQEVTVYNADTIAHLVILQVHDTAGGGTVRVFRRRVLAPLEDWSYSPAGTSLAIRLP